MFDLDGNKAGDCIVLFEKEFKTSRIAQMRFLSSLHIAGLLVLADMISECSFWSGPWPRMDWILPITEIEPSASSC
jgi:hypothetical protein